MNAKPNLGPSYERMCYEFGGRFIYLSAIGSWNYGCANEKSDTDTKGIYVPSIVDIVSGDIDKNIEFSFPNEEYCQVMTVGNFCKQLKKGNPNVLEMLFSNYIYINPDYHELMVQLREHREDIATCCPDTTVRAMMGMAIRNYKLAISPHRQDSYSNKWMYSLARIEECLDKYVQGKPYAECLKTDKRDLLLAIKDGAHQNPMYADQLITRCERHEELYNFTHPYGYKDNEIIKFQIDNLCVEIYRHSLKEEI